MHANVAYWGVVCCSVNQRVTVSNCVLPQALITVETPDV